MLDERTTAMTPAARKPPAVTDGLLCVAPAREQLGNPNALNSFHGFEGF